jgi:hypothetical protein
MQENMPCKCYSLHHPVKGCCSLMEGLLLSHLYFAAPLPLLLGSFIAEQKRGWGWVGEVLRRCRHSTLAIFRMLWSSKLLCFVSPTEGRDLWEAEKD